jgi:hypothetical protein
MPSRFKTTYLTKQKKATFLHAIASGMTVTDACAAIGLSRQHIYFLKDQDPEFNAAWDDANKAKLEIFEAELQRRAMGYQEPLHHRGVRTGDYVTKHSDILLMFLLKKLDPSYRDNAKVEVHIGDRLQELADAISGKPGDSTPEASEEPSE